MSLNLRIFLAYFVILGVATSLLLNVVMSELKPGVRQSTEDTLIDMSNMLAEIVVDDLLDNSLQDSAFSQSMSRFLQRSYRAKIYNIDKLNSSIRIYITDKHGVVKYDSTGNAVGQDYSKWNDVYLTLRGQYGARSTAALVDDPSSTVMHVAAPIKHANQIVGVVTVAKTNLSLQPFINMAQQKIQSRGLWLILVSLVVALVLSYWLTVSIRKLIRYTDNIASGDNPVIPVLHETELAKLAGAIDNMQRQLAGKEYVEKYVYALTHELKSPVSAIKGAAEIIHPQMAAVDQQRFMHNIHNQVERIDEMINRLLSLTQVENQQQLVDSSCVDLLPLVSKILESKALQLSDKSIKLSLKSNGDCKVMGDKFLLGQLLDNLLQNAIDFSDEQGKIDIEISATTTLTLTVKDWGQGIPAYAEQKVFDRFYSLPRPLSDKKSSGLGLCFVKQISKLHSGSISISNHPEGGVIASFTMDSHSPTVNVTS